MMSTGNFTDAQQKLVNLFENWSEQKLEKIRPLPRSGSDRQYFRLYGEKLTAIGVINRDRKENEAFIGFSQHFKKKGIPVPDIYAYQLDEDIYLQEDLGDQTLFQLIQVESEKERFSQELIRRYKRVLSILPEFQIHAGQDLNYKLCYPRARFDRQSMLWDLNYFKYYFLKLAGIPFDEQALEDDYQKFTDFLMSADDDYFLYRDFQSRNIMIKEEKIKFIDYQGGRKGALQYDLASLLYDAKANIPQEIRELLLDHYIQEVKKHTEIDEKAFRTYFSAFVMIRIMQAMGAYGFRGFYEKKAHFLASIPYALDNMKYVLENHTLSIDLPTLVPLLEKLTESEYLRSLGQQKLEVSVNSFSFKRGIPVDESGHGGGHVFDCRALPNPGRQEKYRQLTGKDLKVIQFLEKEEEVARFKANVMQIADQSVENYIKRGFKHLSINFGCTGGQHRSVYMAEQLARHLRNKFEVKVNLRHREQELKSK
jgi:aminoglycoside/choline kinase family phosphotransferase